MGLGNWGYAIPGYNVYKAGKAYIDGTDRSDNEFRDPNRENFDLPGASERDARLSELEQRWGQRTAPQAATPGIGRMRESGASGFRAGQEGLIEQLQRRASGEESLSALQLQDSLGQNIRQQQAMAASARPGQGGLAARSAAQQMGQLGSGLAGQQAMAGLQERLGAQGLLGGVLGQARGQDISQNQWNAGQQNQREMMLAQMLAQNNQFNVGTQMQQQGLNQQGQLSALEQMLQNAQLQQRGSMGYEGARSARWAGLMGQPTGMERGLKLAGDVGSYMGIGAGSGGTE